MKIFLGGNSMKAIYSEGQQGRGGGLTYQILYILHFWYIVKYLEGKKHWLNITGTYVIMSYL
jgi:hypothetical protein